ncbi:hypothetical protein ILYODFUR_036253 [Ilyodon furcidens]|uniref:Uncharacterized protein n=1 Tax=Ilyodon furcidens TaxID=33524 RepID=A0ABV0V8Z8_9TELE
MFCNPLLADTSVHPFFLLTCNLSANTLVKPKDANVKKILLGNWTLFFGKLSRPDDRHELKKTEKYCLVSHSAVEGLRRQLYYCTIFLLYFDTALSQTFHQDLRKCYQLVEKRTYVSF